MCAPFGVVITLLAITGGVYAVSQFGLYPIGADNSPGSLERALAGAAMDHYAEKHKPAGDNPVQVTPAHLMEGAKEYEAHCAFCHGGAKATISPMQHKFNPPTPQLINRIPHDDDAWLFSVTKHGVRMTGMPAWDGILSDDEMWTIVAFINTATSCRQTSSQRGSEWPRRLVRSKSTRPSSTSTRLHRFLKDASAAMSKRGRNVRAAAAHSFRFSSSGGDCAATSSSQSLAGISPSRQPNCIPRWAYL